MKHLFSTALMIVLSCTILSYTAKAQAPNKFNYQGIARNTTGQPLTSQALGLRLTIHDLTATGTVLYQETHGVTTNAYGLYNVAIGSGTVVSGTFASIPWGTGDKFIQVEIDPAGGTTYADLGGTQLLSVPYAIYASQSASSHLADTAVIAAHARLALPYSDTLLDLGSLVKIQNNGDGAAFEGICASTASNAAAIKATISSTSPGGFSSALRATNNGTGGLGVGVYGSQAGSGWGVYGTTPNGLGVYGNSPNGYGLYGNSNSGTGIYSTSTTGIPAVFSITNNANANTVINASTNGTGMAILGVNSSTTGNTIGVRGETYSPSGAALEGKYSGSGVGVALELDNGAIKVSGTNKAAFVHTATPANKLSANGTDIDNPMCNGDANCILIITQKLNPSGIVYNNSPVGVYYNNIRSKWEIFNENNVAIPNNAQFNVLVIKQ